MSKISQTRRRRKGEEEGNSAQELAVLWKPGEDSVSRRRSRRGQLQEMWLMGQDEDGELAQVNNIGG